MDEIIINVPPNFGFVKQKHAPNKDTAKVIKFISGIIVQIVLITLFAKAPTRTKVIQNKYAHIAPIKLKIIPIVNAGFFIFLSPIIRLTHKIKNVKNILYIFRNLKILANLLLQISLNLFFPFFIRSTVFAYLKLCFN